MAGLGPATFVVKQMLKELGLKRNETKDIYRLLTFKFAMWLNSIKPVVVFIRGYGY